MDSLQIPVVAAETLAHLTQAATPETDATVTEDVGAAYMRAAPPSMTADLGEKNAEQPLMEDSEGDKNQGEIPPRFVDGHPTRVCDKENTVAARSTVDHLHRLLADLRSEVPEGPQRTPSNNGFLLKRSYHYDSAFPGRTSSSSASALQCPTTPLHSATGMGRLSEETLVSSLSHPSPAASSRSATSPPHDTAFAANGACPGASRTDREAAPTANRYPEHLFKHQATLPESLALPTLSEVCAKPGVLNTAGDISTSTPHGVIENEEDPGLDAHPRPEDGVEQQTTATGLEEVNSSSAEVTEAEGLAIDVLSIPIAPVLPVSCPLTTSAAAEDSGLLEAALLRAGTPTAGGHSQTTDLPSVTPPSSAPQPYVFAEVPGPDTCPPEPFVPLATSDLLPPAIEPLPGADGCDPTGTSTTIEQPTATTNSGHEDAMVIEAFPFAEADPVVEVPIATEAALVALIPGIVKDSEIVVPCPEILSSTGHALTGIFDARESFELSLRSSSADEVDGTRDGSLDTGGIFDFGKLPIILPAGSVPDPKMLPATVETLPDCCDSPNGSISMDLVPDSEMNAVSAPTSREPEAFSPGSMTEGFVANSNSANIPTPSDCVVGETIPCGERSPSPSAAAMSPLSNQPLGQLPSGLLESCADHILEDTSGSLATQLISQPKYDLGTLGEAASTLIETRLLASSPSIDTAHTLDIEDRAENLEGVVVGASEHHTTEILISLHDVEHHPEDDVWLNLPPSSPPRSSSPPQIFSSSPPRDFSDSPPSSSPPLLPFDNICLDEYEGEATPSGPSEVVSTYEFPPTVERPYPAKADVEEQRPAKRLKTDPSPSLPDGSPLPKRPTQASVARQHKKLAAPFRSPVIRGPLVQGGLHAVYFTGRALMPPPPRLVPAENAEEPSRMAVHVKPDPTVANKDRTANVAKQFKSPLVASGGAAGPSSAASGGLFSTVKAMPTIQTLQGKVQTLKQAIRIRSAGKRDEEDELERLVKKWTTAGREVAWAVWDYVKDLDPGTSAVGQAHGGWSSGDDGFWGTKTGEKRGFDPGWGYDDEYALKKAKLEDTVEEEARAEEEDAVPIVHHTLGTMLRHLSIDPATLGWDEEEGDFVDA